LKLPSKNNSERLKISPFIAMSWLIDLEVSDYSQKQESGFNGMPYIFYWGATERNGKLHERQNATKRHDASFSGYFMTWRFVCLLKQNQVFK